MYKIFTLIHSEKTSFFSFLLKHWNTSMDQRLYFYLKYTGDVHFIMIPLTFSLTILVTYLLIFVHVFTFDKNLLSIGDSI